MVNEQVLGRPVQPSPALGLAHVQKQVRVPHGPHEGVLGQVLRLRLVPGEGEEEAGDLLEITGVKRSNHPAASFHMDNERKGRSVDEK